MVALLLLLASLAPLARAQAPLFLANQNTEVRKISFRFVDHQTFEAETLLEQMATTKPSFFDRVKGILPLLSPAPHPLSPVELQKDVVRLRQYYNRHGFLHPEIDYPASQLDTSSNTLHIIFAIEEGPPVLIQDIGFFGPDGRYAYYVFPEELQGQWDSFRNRVSLRTGERYTEFDRLRIQDETLTWLKNQGYAFAQVQANVDIDSTANTADVRFELQPGPLAHFGDIRVEGNESVSDQVILRELPFEPGDRFSSNKLANGQRELFSLDLFRVALASVPEQPADSTVEILFRVREARPRYLSARTGFATDVGIILQGRWTHRNFLGSARTLTLNLTANTGIGARVTEGLIPPRLFGATVTLRQPYLFSSKLSWLISPFLQFESDPLLLESEALFDVNRREFGVSTQLLYEIYPFRTVSAQYVFSRARQLTQARTDVGTEQLSDIFNQSILSLSATVGKTNNYLNPRRGFLVRPLLESAGRLVSNPGVEFTKATTEVVGYIPIVRNVQLGARLFIGRLWPHGTSKQILDSLDVLEEQGTDIRADSLSIYEDRFDPYLFYAGGSSDVRGWDTGLVGDKVARLLIRGTEANADTIYVIEALGGRAKLGGNLEARLPFPGLSRAFRTAVFLDFAQVTNGGFDLRDFKYGVGAGIRYQTIVGYIRFDVGFKLNPDREDLLNPRQLYQLQHNLVDVPPEGDFMRRFNIHISIGQAF